MTRAAGNPAPGFDEHPGHRIATRPAGKHVQVRFHGETIADTREAVELEEARGGSTVSPIVYYIPRKDVRMDRLVRSDRHTYCPFKGSASYFSLEDGPENAVWSYEHPYDEMLAIEGLLAFDPDKVDAITAVAD